MERKRRLIIFLGFFVLSFIYFRLKVFLFYGGVKTPFLREITGLTIHHFHYGLVFILVAALCLIFYRINFFSVGLMGLGIGTVFDSFVSRLFSFNSVRAEELYAYGSSFTFTLFLFVNIILLAIIFYMWKK